MNALPPLRVKTLSVWNDVLSLSFHGSDRGLSSSRKGRDSRTWAIEARNALVARGMSTTDACSIQQAILASDDLPLMERGRS